MLRYSLLFRYDHTTASPFTGELVLCHTGRFNSLLRYVTHCPDATGSPLSGEPCLPCCAMLGCAMFPVLRALFLAVLLYVTSMPIRCQRSV